VTIRRFPPDPGPDDLAQEFRDALEAGTAHVSREPGGATVVFAPGARPLAVQGQEGCTSSRCRRFVGDTTASECLGWHCAQCGEPTNQYGHPDGCDHG
jgi:hypothetical protein